MSVPRRFIAIVTMCLTSGACSALGIKSVPLSMSTTVQNSAAIDFLRDAPSVSAKLSSDLSTRDMAADGKIVGLSASGGGARATAYTLGVLAELQELTTSNGSNVLDQIDFISSNSGGSWAVAAYLSDRASQQARPYRLRDRAPVISERFFAATSGPVRCWSTAMRSVTDGQTFGSIYSHDRQEALPAAYFNASLLPAHAPFVFTQAFIDYYEVRQFGACASGPEQFGSLANVPIGYAAAASGTVPGFYYAYAETDICTGKAHAASFCEQSLNSGRRNYLRIADGGLYDNIGYKTAFEVLRNAAATAPNSRRAMLLINSSTSTDYKTIPPGERADKFLVTTAKNGLFAVQDSTFERLYRPMFEELGVGDPVLLDFYSSAKFTEADAEQITGGDRIDSLDTLAFYAAQKVKCFVNGQLQELARMPAPGHIPPAARSLEHLRKAGGDCLSENFYRAGTLNKTTYRFDRFQYAVMYELGRLSVRKNRAKILAAVAE